MDTYKDIWQAVIDYCIKNDVISGTGIKTWLSDSEITGLEGNTIFFHLGSPLKKKIVIEQYGRFIEDALENVLGFKVSVEYSCNVDINSGKNSFITDQERDHNMAARVQQALNHSDNIPAEQFTFDTFIEGPSNAFAYRSSMAVAGDPGGNIKNEHNYNPLFIYGKSGLGKTHLLNAICNQIRINFPEMQILYVRSEDFANEFINALGKKTTDEFHNKFRNIDILLIDDIQFIGGKERTEEEFFHTFNSLIENGKQIVLTSDRLPNEIQSLTERLCSRFESGLLADIQSPEYETRCAIIKRKAELLNFNINDSVVSFIAEKIKTNIRQLEGATKKLYALSNISGVSPSIALAQRVIKDVVSDTQPLPVTIDRIIDEVYRTEGVTPAEIKSKKRSQKIVHARMITLYMVREITNISFEAIGEEFNMHHSTVMYNIKQISEEMEKDSKLGRRVNDMINNIKDEN